MKIAVYNYRRDELEFLRKFEKKYKVDLVLSSEAPTSENASLANGCECISIITTPMEKHLLCAYKEVGIKYISTRTIGYDHFDLKAVKELGLHIGNVSYSPNSVADYAVMMILTAIRKLKLILGRAAVQDFSLTKTRGRELRNLTVGVIGTGRIGNSVLKRLVGFGCKLLAYDVHPNSEASQFAEYVPLETLLAESDIIDLHVPATKENVHMINHETISKMKNGVYLINTARGSLIDSDAFINAIECGKVAGAALDVIENETGLYYNDKKGDVIKNKQFEILQSFPNVILTPHTAFYTDQAVSDMVEHSIESCVLFKNKDENPWQII